MASTNGHHYRFDTFEVDPANRILMRDGEVIHVTARVFDILLAFVESPGQLLEKDELIKKVWHNDFVEDGNLTRNVSTLRKTLGDTAREHRYITTVPGHGYRFTANVSDVSPGDHQPSISYETPGPTDNHPSANSARLSFKWLWAALLATLLIIAIWSANR